MSQPPPQQPQGLPDDFDDLDFTVEDEDWNEYELSDNSRIRTRTILTKIMADPTNPNALVFDISPIIISVHAPPPNRGERNNEPQPHEYNTLPSFEIRINRSDERWNVFRILRSGRIVRLRDTVTRIRRVTNRFNNHGLPFYLIDHAAAISIDPPDNQPGP